MDCIATKMEAVEQKEERKIDKIEQFLESLELKRFRIIGVGLNDQDPERYLISIEV